MRNFFYDSFTSFFVSLFPGILVAMCYDVFRIIRIGDNTNHSALGERYARFMPKKTISLAFISRCLAFYKRIFYFVEDIIFWLIASCIEILFVFYMYEGEIRIYSIILAVLGFFLYYHSLGILVLHFAKHIYLIVRFIGAWIWFITLYPFVQMLKIFRVFVKFIYRATVLRWKERRHYQMLLTWSNQKQYDLLCAALNGFIIDQRRST